MHITHFIAWYTHRRWYDIAYNSERERSFLWNIPFHDFINYQSIIKWYRIKPEPTNDNNSFMIIIILLPEICRKLGKSHKIIIIIHIVHIINDRVCEFNLTKLN
jgi:hypothetical protein